MRPSRERIERCLCGNGATYKVYTALAAFAVNLAVAAILTVVFKLVGATNGKDETAVADYEDLVPAGAAAS